MSELKVVNEIVREDGVVFKTNDFVKHFKGNLYRIKGFAMDCETLELFVVYKDINKSILWTRKVDDFLSKKGDVWRFEHI